MKKTKHDSDSDLNIKMYGQYPRTIQSLLVVGKKTYFKHFSYYHGLMKANDSSSHRWVQRQVKDTFVKRAQKENYRCRSAFKLLQIDDKYGILQPGYFAIDCGAAPGSWTQVAVERVNSDGTDPSNPRGFVIGVDLQDMSPVEGAVILPSSDFTKQETQEEIKTLLAGKKSQVILSDMAPSATGIKSHNHQVIIDICFSLLRFSLGVLQEDGALLCKIWMGERQRRLEYAMKSFFRDVQTVKPEASRSESAEIFILAQGFSGLNLKKS